MSSPRTKSKNTPQPLSDTEIAQIATEIAAGRPPMVWFTAAAVGIPEGRSGKVIALGEPSDGDFLQIRPTGSKDVLSFSPAEVTMTKPARDRAVAQPASTTRKESPTVTKPSAPTSTPATPPAQASAAKPAPEPATSNGAAKPAPARPQPATPAQPKPAAKAPARKSKAAEVTVTISGTADGEWSVDVVNGKKRTVRALPVNSAAVAQAAKLLHPEVSEVVGGIMEAVRVAQLAKVEQLQAELEEAKKLLAELPD
ncbi:DUF6319 family protein [Nocardia cyriacigeorgica]|uniref:DUF6319 family protein n=1 Tax=Nocardia cyriacigeorgica TaxID=135487 RepID=UPI0018931578|nr:DUF6319 family protein [Nocardia cyriacigeorgica]MBF6086807.1 hypothetical protein [Nocardia cyriacigeorgica]MBF6090868.1 hypothetical protein [Nocardia cyriacigeorgica]MBF6159082.1 hypothetical protein [Nocardia cyriacigeorgica]MBF6197232.1 hypothetical protein [Nocardia cyriacigeorgica]